MRQWFLPAALLLAVSGCKDSSGSVSETGTGTATDTGGEPEVVLERTFDLEVHEVADVRIVRTGDEVLAVVRLGVGFGVAPQDTDLEGPARVDEYPEAGATLYTARLSVPAQAEGPCEAEPVSLALSLHSDADSSFIAGGLTPYCGDQRWHGIPVIEPLRLSAR